MLNPKAIQVIQLVNKATNNSLTGYSFFSIRNYKAKGSGEVANHLINIGIDYAATKKKDEAMLRKLDLVKAKKEGKFKSELEHLQEAKAKLIVSLVNPSETASNGQIDAYTVLTNGIKVHNEKGELFVYGFAHSKTVITEGKPKTKSSNPVIIAQNELEKIMKSKKYRQYSLVVGENQELKAI